ncbi:MAG TPA: magnesium transporter, partial [Candidatus Binatia bacterium]|nr:magnesium transporter [Candidatus Binatia bacterium]
MADKGFAADELDAAWPALSVEERVEGFELLPRDDAEKFFLQLSARDQAQMILALPQGERRLWLRLLAPDEAVDLIQEVPQEKREDLLQLLDETTRREVKGLLAYAEDDAGGLMNPRYARLRPDMSVDEAISYLRRDARARTSVYYAFVVDSENRLMGVVSFRDLFAVSGDRPVHEVMRKDIVTASEDMDQEALSHLFAKHNLLMIPVVDSERRIKGVVTFDDIMDVVQEEATEDIQKIGGTQALEAPYLQVPLLHMIKKRAGWLVVLFLGEMLTATAMGYFEEEIARAVVLALFVPLIISSGGNSGSQATTLVIRAMALGELRLRDWWRVIRRELATGLALGSILGAIGLLRILLWQKFFHLYGEHYILVAVTVA